MSTGRPRKYFGEPPVKRHFDLPKALNDELVAHSSASGRAAVVIVQDALREHFNRSAGPLAEVLDLEPEQVAQLRKMARNMEYLSATAFLGDLAKRLLEMPEEFVEALMYGDIQHAVEREVEAEESADKARSASKRRRAA